MQISTTPYQSISSEISEMVYPTPLVHPRPWQNTYFDMEIQLMNLA